MGMAHGNQIHMPTELEGCIKDFRMASQLRCYHWLQTCLRHVLLWPEHGTPLLAQNIAVYVHNL